MNPELQTRLRDEIKETLVASNGELTYDSVHGMVYLNMVAQGNVAIDNSQWWVPEDKIWFFRNATNVSSSTIPWQKMYKQRRIFFRTVRQFHYSSPYANHNTCFRYTTRSKGKYSFFFKFRDCLLNQILYLNLLELAESGQIWSRKIFSRKWRENCSLHIFIVWSRSSQLHRGTFRNIANESRFDQFSEKSFRYTDGKYTTSVGTGAEGYVHTVERRNCFECCERSSTISK